MMNESMKTKHLPWLTQWPPELSQCVLSHLPEADSLRLRLTDKATCELITRFKPLSNCTLGRTVVIHSVGVAKNYVRRRYVPKQH
jgi:hypothetical protein